MKKLLLFLLLPVCLCAQTIRPTRVSQLRLTQLTTAQEGTMSLVAGDTWFNVDLDCKRMRLSSSSVCMLIGVGAADAIVKTPSANQIITGPFNLTLDGNFLLTTTGQNICSSSVRCDFFGQTLDISTTSMLTGNITFGASLLPSATGQDVGSPTVRPDAFLEDVVTGDLSGIRIVHADGEFPTVQAAHDDLPSTGGTILVPPGTFDSATNINFTKDIRLLGSGIDITILRLTGTPASNLNGITTNSSLYVSDLTIQTQTPPTSFLAMKGIATTNAGVAGAVPDGTKFIIERVRSSGFNKGFFADGRDVALTSFNLDIAHIRDCFVDITGDSGFIASQTGISLHGAELVIVEGCTVDNQSTGDHNIYSIRSKSVTIQDNRLMNTPANTAEAVKLATEDVASATNFERWTVRNNEMFNNGLFVVVITVGATRIALLDISGNSMRTQTDTNASNGGAVLLSFAGTTELDNFNFNGNKLEDLQLGGLRIAIGASTTLRNMYAFGNVIKDFSKSSSGTFGAMIASSSGTKENVTIVGLDADGNSTGKNAVDMGTVTRLQLFDIRERNMTAASVLNQPTLVSRISANQGTPIVAGDFALTGWGTTASVGTITGTDQWMQFTITSAGTGQTSNPLARLTFSDGVWANPPVAVCQRADRANQPAIHFTWITTITRLDITFRGTPVAAETFVVACNVGGV